MYFNVYFNVFFKVIKVYLLASELYIYQNVRSNNKKMCICLHIKGPLFVSDFIET